VRAPSRIPRAALAEPWIPSGSPDVSSASRIAARASGRSGTPAAASR
jgi:hypothetical protein